MSFRKTKGNQLSGSVIMVARDIYKCTRVMGI